MRNNSGPLRRSKYCSLAGIGSLAAVLMTGGITEGRSDATGGEIRARSELAFCQVSARAGCQCSFATLETPFTFSEAAGVISVLYKNFPDERYSHLLEGFLHQCAGEITPTSPAQPMLTIRGDAGAQPRALIQAPPAVKGGRP